MNDVPAPEADVYGCQEDFVAPCPEDRFAAHLSKINEVIENSRSLLELEDDWDDAGSPHIERSTWDRAARFLSMYASWAWNQHKREIAAPAILPGPGGSIDLHWDEPKYEFLVNIPAEADEMAAFYGDDRGSATVKGKLDPNKTSEGLLLWLTK